jgi:hypothetical protein
VSFLEILLLLSLGSLNWNKALVSFLSKGFSVGRSLLLFHLEGRLETLQFGLSLGEFGVLVLLSSWFLVGVTRRIPLPSMTIVGLASLLMEEFLVLCLPDQGNFEMLLIMDIIIATSFFCLAGGVLCMLGLFILVFDEFLE